MCGPLVMLIGRHRFRYFYFFGRTLSFGLAGLIAGEAGAIVHVVLKRYYLAETFSLVFGILISLWGVYLLAGRPLLSSPVFSGKVSLNRFKKWFSLLLLKDTRSTTFLFGFFTLALPCGQTLIVFSACALVGDPWIGAANGLAFALLTSPSLFLAMHTLALLKKLKRYDNAVLGGCSLSVGILAVCRGLAEMGWISHWVLNPEASTRYHIVIY